MKMNQKLSHGERRDFGEVMERSRLEMKDLPRRSRVLVFIPGHIEEEGRVRTHLGRAHNRELPPHQKEEGKRRTNPGLHHRWKILQRIEGDHDESLLPVLR